MLHAAPFTPPRPTLLLTAHPRIPSQANQQIRVPAATQRSAPAPPESREASPLPPFGFTAVLPPHPMYKKRTRRNACRNAHAPAPQPRVPVGQSTQALLVPSLIDLRVNAPPSQIAHASASESRPRVSPAEIVQALRAPPRTFVQVSSLLPLNPRAALLRVQEPVRTEQHLAPVAKSLAWLFALWMRIVIGNATRLRTVGTAQP